MFADADFWLHVLSQWKQAVTGPFSARFLVPGWLISVAVIFGLSPDSMGALASAGLTGLLIIGGFFYALFKVWESAASRVSTGARAASSNTDTTALLVPDSHIRELFFHLCPALRSPRTDNLVEHVGQEILDKLSTRQLKAWGRPVGNPTMAEIDSEYWRNAEWVYWLLDHDGGDVLAARPLSSREYMGLPQYREVYVSTSQALRLKWKRFDEPDEFIAMPEAARLLYEEARKADSLWAYAAERLGGTGLKAPSTEQEILDYMATFLAGKAQLYGVRPPSRVVEEIAADKSVGTFENGGRDFRFLLGRSPTYSNLKVKRAELDGVIAHVRRSAKSGGEI